jgi:hypothetical protein
MARNPDPFYKRMTKDPHEYAAEALGSDEKISPQPRLENERPDNLYGWRSPDRAEALFDLHCAVESQMKRDFSRGAAA